VGSDETIYVRDWYSCQATADVWVDELLYMAKHHDALKFIGEGGPIRRAIEPWLDKRMRELEIYVATEWLVAMSRESDNINGKAVGARAFQAMCRMGRVRFPRTAWAERVIDQLCGFPGNIGHKDDCVDACALFGRFIASVWAAVEPVAQKPFVWDAPLKISDLMPLHRAD
jgi:hypothetical protein